MMSVNESPGETLARLGTDAAKWTDEFLNYFHVTPKYGEMPDNETARDWQWGTMVAWFASAIETGRSESYKVDQQEWFERGLMAAEGVSK